MRIILIKISAVPFPFDSFDLPFMQRALAVTVVMGVGGGILGTWLVLREMAFSAHALSSSTLPALMLATALHFSPVLLAFGSSLFAAALLNTQQRKEPNSQQQDVAAGFLLAGSLALGVFLASNVFPEHSNFTGALLGSLFALNFTDLLLSTIITAGILFLTLRYHRQWLQATFTQTNNEQGRQALLFLLAGAIAGLLPVSGSLLTASLLLLPAATARLIATGNIKTLYLTAVFCAVGSSTSGLLISYQADIPPGATITLCASSLFIVVACTRKLITRYSSYP